MEKTISGLNSRSWYRLLKVLYVGVFLVVVLFGLLLIFDSNQLETTVDNARTTIECDYPVQHNITAADGGVYFMPSDFTDGEYNNFNKNAEIQDACGMTDYVNNLISRAGNLQLGTNGFPSHLFPVDPVFDSEGGWSYILGYSLLFIVIVVAISEGLRRVFYYVVLGSFKPHK